MPSEGSIFKFAELDPGVVDSLKHRGSFVRVFCSPKFAERKRMPNLVCVLEDPVSHELKSIR